MTFSWIGNISNHSARKTNIESRQPPQQIWRRFGSKLGTLKCMKARLSVKEGTVPKFYKPRTVPLAMRKNVNDELEICLSAEFYLPSNGQNGQPR